MFKLLWISLKKNKNDLFTFLQESQKELKNVNQVEVPMESGEKKKFLTKEDMVLKSEVSKPYVLSIEKDVVAYLNTSRNEELDLEGYSREFVRRVQLQRKKLKLLRKDVVKIFVECENEFILRSITSNDPYIKERVNCEELNVVKKLDESLSYDDVDSENLKENKIKIALMILPKEF